MKSNDSEKVVKMTKKAIGAALGFTCIPLAVMILTVFIVLASVASEAQGIVDAPVNALKKVVDFVFDPASGEEMFGNLMLSIMNTLTQGAGDDPMMARYIDPPDEAEITNPEKSIKKAGDWMIRYIQRVGMTGSLDEPKYKTVIFAYLLAINKNTVTQVDDWIQYAQQDGGYTEERANQYISNHSLEMYIDINTVNEIYDGINDGGSIDQMLQGQAKEVLDILALTEKGAWKLVTNGKYDHKPVPGSITQNQASKLMSTIQVRVWHWKGDRGYDKKEVKVSITVNKQLIKYWKSYFEDVFNDESKPVISSVSCYCFRINTPGTALSSHSFGTAIDINPSSPGNGYGQVPYTQAAWDALPESRGKYESLYEGCPIVTIAQKSYGLNWGGTWSGSKDGMHLSFVGDGRTRETLNEQIEE